jgi:hypothetical protein
MNEQPKSKRMELIRFGKGQGFAHEAGQALAQGVEPALDMSGLTTGLTHRLMPVGGENTPVSLPKITERVAARVGARNASPEVQTTGFAAVTDEVRHNLAGAAAQRPPYPALIGFLEHKRPQFVQFQHVLHLGFDQRRFHGRESPPSFPSSAPGVLRERPNMRAMPRKLARCRRLFIVRVR